MKNIQNLNAYKKRYIDFCHQIPPPLKMVCPPTDDFSQFFSKILFFF